MTKTKSTKRALLASALALVLCVSMLIGSTFAWFTDSVTSGSNVIKSGNLDIEVEYTLDGENWENLDGADDLFQKGLWEPGHTEVVALKITNAGSLALKYNASMNIVKETIGKNKDGGDIKLSDILTVSTLTQQANDDSGFGDVALELAFMGENSVRYETTTTFKAGNVLGNDVELQPGVAHYVIVKVDMAETVGNEANAKDQNSVPSIEFGINVLATQFTSEYDSFGNQYDKDATYPVATVADLKAALAAGGNVVLGADITYNNTDPDKQMLLESKNEINFDGNGNTITVTGSNPGVGNHGYVAFIPTGDVKEATVSNLTVTGIGFVELGDYNFQGGTYTANNLVIENLVSTLANGNGSDTVGCAFMQYGTGTLNNCVMTGTTALIDGTKPYDAGFGNTTTTTINGGKYGVIRVWEQAHVTINGAEIDTIDSRAITTRNLGMLTIGAGTHVGTINLIPGSYTPALTIEEGATVDAIVYNGVTYTQAEWLAR